jgi:hypothetical protein
MPVDSVPGAWRQLFSTANITSVPGGLWLNATPNTLDITRGAWAVLTMRENFEFTFERDYIERDLCKIRIFGITAAAVEAGVIALRAASFWKQLPMFFTTPIEIEPTEGEVADEEVRAPNGELVFHWDTYFNVKRTLLY